MSRCIQFARRKGVSQILFILVSDELEIRMTTLFQDKDLGLDVNYRCDILQKYVEILRALKTVHLKWNS